MNDIRIYDFEFNLLHIEPNVMSAYWILKYNDVGTFEGTFPLTSKICNVIMKNRYLILVQGEFQAIVTAYLADTKLTVYGKTPNWILTRRTFPAFNKSATPGAIGIHIVSTAFADVENFECFDLSTTTSSKDIEREERNPVSNIIKEELDKYNLGHKVRFDIPNKKWIFEIYSGKHLPFLISEKNRNVKDVSISDDAQDFFCSGWYNAEWIDCGEWNPSIHSWPTTTPDSYGKYYRITSTNNSFPDGGYLYCADRDGTWNMAEKELPALPEVKIQGTLSGIYDWDTFLSSASLQESQTELSGKKWTHTTKAVPVSLKYKVDYDLGDSMRVQVQKGSYTEDVEKIISCVDVWWENGNVGEKISFKEDGNVA